MSARPSFVTFQQPSSAPPTPLFMGRCANLDVEKAFGAEYNRFGFGNTHIFDEREKYISEYLNTLLENIINRECDVNHVFKDFFDPAEGTKPNIDFFLQKLKEDFDYNTQNTKKYKEYISKLKTLKENNTHGFVRVISQNMHCRANSLIAKNMTMGKKYSDDEAICEAYPPVFYDDQLGRTVAFANSIYNGEINEIDPDIISIQEMQEDSSRHFFKKTFHNMDKWKLILPIGKATKVTVSVPSGLGFVYNTNKVRHIRSKLHQFPTEYSSGANAGAVGTIQSFKGVLVGEFQHIQSNKYITIFNIHPSPYVDLPEYEGTTSPRSELVDQIVKTHMYQCIFIALLMKEMYEEKSIPKPTILLCGDWNINKFLSNGTTGLNNETTLQAAYKQIIEEGRQKNKNVISVLSPTVKKCFKEDEPYIGTGTATGGSPIYCDEICCGAEIKTVYEILQAIPPAHLKFIQESKHEAIVPFGGKYTWDALFNSVMYSPLWSTFNFQLIDHIVYSRYGAIPSFAFTKVRRLTPNHAIPVTQGLLSNSCITNKNDIAYNRQLLEHHTHYKNKYSEYKDQRTRSGKLTQNAYYYNFYNEQYNQIKERIESLEKNIPFEISPHLRKMYTNPENEREYFYFDLADHYAIECVLILDDSEDTIDTLKTFMPEKSLFECWQDNMIDEVIINNEMFPRQWFNCSHTKIKQLPLQQYDEILKNVPLKNILKNFFWMHKKYNNSVAVETILNACIEEFKSLAGKGTITSKTSKEIAFREIQYIINSKFPTLSEQNESPFVWNSSPIKDIVKIGKNYKERDINNAAMKFFHRFLEREIMNRHKYGDVPLKLAKVQIEKLVSGKKLYNINYLQPVGIKERNILDRNNILQKINRGLIQDIRTITKVNKNRSASLLKAKRGIFNRTFRNSPTKQVLYSASASVVGGRYTRRRKHRAMTRRKHRQQKRHTRKH